MRRRLAVLVCAATPLVVSHLAAQTSGGQRVAFEVASVKANKSGGRRSSGGLQPGGRFTLTNTTAASIIQSAYHLLDVQVIGGPNWIKTDRFDVVATAPARFVRGQIPLMVQDLLVSRFRLQFHHETRPLQGSRLVMARSDKRLGPRLQRASDADADCTSRPPLQPDASGVPKTPPCGIMRGVGRFSARGLTMGRLATALAGTDAPVFDETGLDGTFNADLEWTPDDLRAGPPDAQAVAAPSGGPLEPPPFVTAMQDQLGLRIETIKEPVDVLVVDQLQHPTEN